MKKTVAVCTLGCKVNQYESEAVLELFLKAGYQMVDFSESAMVYVVNTCTVTHLSDRKSRQMIRRAKQKNPNSVLVVMGCYAQTNPEAVTAIQDVDIVLGTAQRSEVVALTESFLQQKEPVCLVGNIDGIDFEPLSVNGSVDDHTRAYLKVQDGCNQFCSYCIIPYARGRIRSRTLADTVQEAARLANAGFKELVLTGIHLASWGKDSGEGNLLTLLKELQLVEGLSRIRLGSLEPTLCDEPFVRGVATLSKVCHHFHLSLQSGCDATLKRMNRKYTTAQYGQAVAWIRNYMPEAAITTDIIAGFPGETEAEFNETMAFVEQLYLADAHIFPYSPRKGTPAAVMEGQISPEIKEVRTHQLLQLTEKSREQFAQSFIGQNLWVLFERKTEPGLYEGKTEQYVTVYVKTEENLIGQIRQVTLTAFEYGSLYGVVTESAEP
ncbi:MAG: tRNA (N(6)-L-threonylcarbamoyladenosine(37)-C(2))-methylthiotransferase MtaB [Ruminococcaceae bacterium]|nr:tRNA (N(6)-L-threonylcarbamoyladenosine(37)-C(2))-methylthiotransferase MtaB [Oscillospiraceae bacterium]